MRVDLLHAFKKHDTTNSTPFKVCAAYYFLRNTHEATQQNVKVLYLPPTKITGE